MWWVVLLLLLFSRKSGSVTATVSTSNGVANVGTPATVENQNPWATGAKGFGTTTAPAATAPPTAFHNPDTIPNAWPGLATNQNSSPMIPSGAGAGDRLIMTTANGQQVWQQPNGSTYTIWATDDPAINAGVGNPPQQVFEGGPAVAPSNATQNLLVMAPPPAEPMIPRLDPIGNVAQVSKVITMPTADSSASFLQIQGVNTPRLNTL